MPGFPGHTQSLGASRRKTSSRYPRGASARPGHHRRRLTFELDCLKQSSSTDRKILKDLPWRPSPAAAGPKEANRPYHSSLRSRQTLSTNRQLAAIRDSRIAL
jgi:hypothetical protein